MRMAQLAIPLGENPLTLYSINANLQRKILKLDATLGKNNMPSLQGTLADLLNHYDSESGILKLGAFDNISHPIC
jgi:hypothetical protein